MQKLFAVLVLLAAVSSASNPQWTIIEKDWEAIAMSVSFTSATNGWVGGGSGSLQALVLLTTNGGANFTNEGLVNQTDAAFMALRMGTPNFGVAGALGFFGLPCGASTTNGQSWTVTHDGVEIICASQGVAAVDDGLTAVMIGAWATPGDFDGNGIQITLDGGATWTQINWNQGGAPARYGDFISANLGFVTGGIWPGDDNEVGKFPRQLTSRLSFDGSKVNVIAREKTASPTDGYQGIIAKVTNNGKTFTTVLNTTGQMGIYFNEISCTDANNCWAVAEGVDNSGQDVAYVFYTSNGGTSWSQQLTATNGSLVAIEMLSPTFGWAGGALLDGNEVKYGQMWQTTDGTHWNLYQNITGFYVMDISVPSQNAAFAAGLTPVGLSSLAKYSS